MGEDDNSDRDDRTLYIGNLSEKVTEALLYELFLQAGKRQRVSIHNFQITYDLIIYFRSCRKSFNTQRKRWQNKNIRIHHIQTSFVR